MVDMNPGKLGLAQILHFMFKISKQDLCKTLTYKENTIPLLKNK
jgi:hypothetical protein